MKKRVKIIFSYDGAAFFGSQIQKKSNIPTVMGNFQIALNALGINTVSQASGRTDKSVHACNQVCHLDISKHFYDLDRLKKILNHHLKPYIFIKDIRFVNPDFHARFNAKKRLYRYIVSHSLYNPLQTNYVTFMPKFDLHRLNSSIKTFEGTHNFAYFKKKGSDTSSDIRIIYKAYAYKHKQYTVINFLGNSFLRSQIRLMCGFLFGIEKGKLSTEDLENQLNLKHKIYTNPAPPHALYLSRIFY
ncbi:MAG: tRNA pseudouridine(38-40) synthase TruA [Sulfurospirillum sp.]